MNRRIRVARAEGIRRRRAERSVTPEIVAAAYDSGRLQTIVSNLRRSRSRQVRAAHVLYRAVTMLARTEGK